jgi:hypothetical protein
MRDERCFPLRCAGRRPVDVERALNQLVDVAVLVSHVSSPPFAVEFLRSLDTQPLDLGSHRGRGDLKILAISAAVIANSTCSTPTVRCRGDKLSRNVRNAMPSTSVALGLQWRLPRGTSVRAPQVGAVPIQVTIAYCGVGPVFSAATR